ncbi:G5 domain-containing protein [Streptococcus sp. E24BD]|uniref:G5 domain-containing protein n=2 Tax=unclassified Streptococcus TaxID=2608887 RepID=UPI00359E4191
MKRLFSNWERLQRFSIRKLSVGVVSATVGAAILGFAMVSQPAQAQSQEVSVGQSITIDYHYVNYEDLTPQEQALLNPDKKLTDEIASADARYILVYRQHQPLKMLPHTAEMPSELLTLLGATGVLAALVSMVRRDKKSLVKFVLITSLGAASINAETMSALDVALKTFLTTSYQVTKGDFLPNPRHFSNRTLYAYQRHEGVPVEASSVQPIAEQESTTAQNKPTDAERSKEVVDHHKQLADQISLPSQIAHSNQTTQKPSQPIETSRTEVIPYKTEIIPDASLPLGEEVIVQTGVTGVLTYTYLNGELVSSQETTSPVPERIRRGTKPDTPAQPVETSRTEVIPYKTEIIPDASLPLGEEVIVQTGVTGVLTYTYLNGELVSSQETTSPVPERIRRGTKPDTPAQPVKALETERQEEVIPYQTHAEEDNHLWLGEHNVLQKGQVGRKEVVTLYQTIDGHRQPNPEIIERILEDPKDEIIRVGTKSIHAKEVEHRSEPIDFTIERQEDPDLWSGETVLIRPGQPGLKSIVTTYQTERGLRTGTVLSEVAEVITQPVSQVEKVGTKPEAGRVTETEDQQVEFRIIYQDNPTKPVDYEETLQAGVEGLIRLTHIYQTYRGQKIGQPETHQETIRQVQDAIIERGSKVLTLADRQEPQPIRQIVRLGDSVVAAASIQHVNLNHVASIAWKEGHEPRTDKVGAALVGRVVVTYTDHSQDEVAVLVDVLPALPRPVVTFDAIAGDNVINAHESRSLLTITGQVSDLQEGDQLMIQVGTVGVLADLTADRFSAQIDGQALVSHQSLSAQVLRAGEMVAGAQQLYAVKTELAQPSLTINPIATDDVINLEESRNSIVISGLVTGAKDGEEVDIACGCPICQGVQWVTAKARIENGQFQITLSGNQLTEGTVVKAQVTTSDAYGNTATGRSERVYRVDMTPPEPSLTYNQLTAGNIINLATPDTVTISGEIINLADDETAILTAKLGDTTHHVTISGRSYSLTLPKTAFESDDRVRLTLTATDPAGNRTTVSNQEQIYTYDVTLPTPVLTLDRPTVVNSRAETLVLAGQLTQDEAVRARTVSVSLDGQTHPAELVGNRWTVTLPAGPLKQTQGNHLYTVQAQVTDLAGNTAQTSQTGTILVDTVAPSLTIQLEPLAIIDPTSSSAIVLKGQISGHQAGDKVVVSLAGQEQEERLESDGHFSLTLDRQALVTNASRQLTARVTSRDAHGNDSQAQASLTYQVAAVATEVTLSLDSITADDHINVTEATKPTTTITGQVTGGNGQPVLLMIGDQQVKAAISGDRFTAQVTTADLVTNPTYAVTARLGDKTISRAYTVVDWATAQVLVTQLGDMEQGDTVRVSGHVTLDGLAAKHGNREQLHEISLTIKDKTYYAGVDRQQNFTFNLPLSDLLAAKGEQISFGQKGDPIYHIEARYGRNNLRLADDVVGQALPQLTSQQVQFTDDHIFKDGKVAMTLPEKLTQIKGQVSGAAKSGDLVTLGLGEETVTARVAEDKSFTITLPSALLKNNSSGLLSIALETKDYQGRAIQVSDLIALSQEQVSADLIATFEHSNTDKPYFLAALSRMTPSVRGYLPIKTFKYTETPVITYGFAAPTYRHDAINQANRDAARRIFDLFSRYANVTFEQVGADRPAHTPDANIVYYLHNNTAANNAASGGDVNIGGRNGQGQEDHRDWSLPSFRHLFIHETFHSFGSKHAHEGYPVLPPLENQSSLSVMTYRAPRMDLDSFDLKLYDLIYLHYRFGVNPAQRSGNDTYRFQDFDRHKSDGNIYIWDGGGVDTFDASHEDQAVTVNLTPGSWIYRGEKADTLVVKDSKEQTIGEFFADDPNYQPTNTVDYGAFANKYVHDFQRGQAFIGYGTQIERLIGSRFADELRGNVANNAIYGGDGDDRLFGDAGNDYLDGGLGADLLDGGAGDDVFIVDNSGDTVIERVGEGTDTVIASVDYSLPEQVENLTLVGQARRGTGNTSDNRITGNSLSNTLTGGGGQDTFIFNSPLNGQIDTINDFDADDVIELSANIFTGIDRNNPFGRIHYERTSGYLAYLPSQVGQTDAIIFAKLPEGLDLRADQIVIN